MKKQLLLIILACTGFSLMAQIKKADTVKNLREVVIKSKRPLVQVEIDKTIVNPDAMIGGTGGNTLEMLEKTPGVTVDAAGGISLNGRGGVMVLIDGRQTFLSGADLAGYLKSLPAGTIDKIELMDNPPARYDAAGNAIINLRLKKNRAGGITGNLSSGYSHGRFARSNHNLNLNYNHKKINIFANTGYSIDKSYTTDRYNRDYFGDSTLAVSRVLLSNDQQSRGNGINLNTGLDYTAGKNTVIGLQLNLNRNDRTGDFWSGTESFSAAGSDSSGRGYTYSNDHRTNLGANLNLYHKFARSGAELSADIAYLRNQGDGNQDLENTFYAAGGNLIRHNNFRYQLPSAMEVYTVKTDYVLPLKNKTRLEAGFKWSSVANDNRSDYYQMQGAEQVTDNSRSNHFLYKEHFTAAYLSAQKSWKQLGVQFGLRAEHTDAEGRQLGNTEVVGSEFKKSYTQLFPTLFINYKLDTLSRHTLGFMLSRRINRPNYQRLNPFLFYRDQYSYSTGNPDLMPQYQYRYELKYQYAQWLRTGLSYNHFTDIVFETTNVTGDTFITRPENVAQGYMLLLNTSLSLDLAKWWRLYTDILLSKIGLDGIAYGERLNPDTYVARINILHQFRFEKGWTAELGGYYASRDLSGQAYTSGMYRINAGIQKKVLKDKGSIRLNMDDIFHTWKYENKSIALRQAYAYQTSYSDTRRITLSFSYSFGNELFARKSKHRDNALDEEKSRM